MKIDNVQTKYTAQFKAIPRQSPSFSGIKYNPKLLKDIYILQNLHTNKGLNSLKNIRAGKFGTICDGSVSLKPFWYEIKKRDYLKIWQTGRSTNADGFPRSFLKSSADKPLSTSYVHSCSVMYLYNKHTNTHFLYHASEEVPKSELDYMVKNFMPEGCTHAVIKPGDNYWAEIHQFTLTDMFNSIRQNAPDAVINASHDSSKYPEIVGYKGHLYEIFNKDIKSQDSFNLEDHGQASFKICDIQGVDTIDAIKYDAYNRASIEKLKEKFSSKNWDSEMKKTLYKILDDRKSSICAIEDCTTPQELAKLVKSRGKNFKEEYECAFAEKINSFRQKFNSYIMDLI